MWVAHAPGMPGTFSPPPRVSDPDMHHGTCVTHVPWCIPGSLTSDYRWSRWRENVPGIPGACTTWNFTYLARGPWPLTSWPSGSAVVQFRQYYCVSENLTMKYQTCIIYDLENTGKQWYHHGILASWSDWGKAYVEMHTIYFLYVTDLMAFKSFYPSDDEPSAWRPFDTRTFVTTIMTWTYRSISWVPHHNVQLT